MSAPLLSTRPTAQALFPLTDNVTINVGAGVGDLLLLVLLRASLTLLPQLGIAAALQPGGLMLRGAADGVSSAWLTTKAVAALKLSHGAATFEVTQTGVRLHTALLLVAELLGVTMTWLLFVLVWANRHVLQQPASELVTLVALARGDAVRMQVARWVASSTAGAPTGAVRADLEAPLLLGEQWSEQQQHRQQQEQQQQPPHGEPGRGLHSGRASCVSFASARSRAASVSGGSLASASSQPEAVDA